MTQSQRKILIVGGGVAALEACLGLHHDPSLDLDVELVTETHEFVYRPLAVFEPFVDLDAPSYPIKKIVAGSVSEIHFDAIAAVDTEQHQATTRSGAVLDFDALIVATGAEPLTQLENAIVVGAPGSMDRLKGLVAQIDAGLVDRVVFCAPDGASWTLPLYELAMLTAHRAKTHLRPLEVCLVTPQQHPLIEFGVESSARVVKLLAEYDVRLLRGAAATEYRDGTLRTRAGDAIESRFVVATPELRGVPIPGLPHNAKGFLPVDEFGRVAGVDGTFAAGDITDFQFKQGGIASQQADAVTAAVIEQLGGRTALHGFQPDLRGLLVTPQGFDFISATGSAAEGDDRIYRLRDADLVESKIYSKHLSARLSHLRASLHASG